jgi:coproporphyrinogen III oxidase
MYPGQILIMKPDATALPDPAHFDIARVMKTCLLVREFQPLLSQRLIESEEQKQLELIAKGTYIPSNLVIFGRGTLVSLVNPTPTPPLRPKANTGD